MLLHPEPPTLLVSLMPISPSDLTGGFSPLRDFQRLGPWVAFIIPVLSPSQPLFLSRE